MTGVFVWDYFWNTNDYVTNDKLLRYYILI